MIMDRLTIINLEWNCYGGFIFEILHLNLSERFDIDIDNSLFGLNISKDFLYIDLFWMEIKVFDKTGL